MHTLLLLLAVVAGPPQARPDSAAPAPAVAVPAAPAGAPVVIRADTIFRVYGRLGASLPEERAARIATRLAELAARVRGVADSVRVVEEEGQTLVMAGEVAVMAVLDGDAAPQGLTREAAGALYAEAIRATLGRHAFQVRLQHVLYGALKSLGALALAAILVWLLRRLFTRLDRLVDQLGQSGRLPTIRVQQLELLSPQRVAATLRFLLRPLRLAVWLVLGYAVLTLVLSFFPMTQGVARRVLDYLVTPLAFVVGSIADYLPNLIFIAAIIIAARWLLRFIRFLFDAIGRGAVTLGGFEREWAEPTYKLARFVVLAFALVVLFPYLPGSGSEAFKGVSLFAGLLFSLGSTGAVANVVAGSLLTYTRGFRIGDRVRIGDSVGDVTARTLLVTRLRTVTNVEITIPNATVLGTQVMNYTTLAREGRLFLQTSITIGYDVPWRTVHELLLTAARSTEAIADDPAPFVIQTSLNDYYPTYVLNAATGDAGAMLRTTSRLNERIQDVFFEAGVEITSPAFTAVRDGNRSTIPAAHLPPDYQPPAFRVDAHVNPRDGGSGPTG
jgi:small-conductance mechanosensitive channel